MSSPIRTVEPVRVEDVDVVADELVELGLVLILTDVGGSELEMLGVVLALVDRLVCGEAMPATVVEHAASPTTLSAERIAVSRNPRVTLCADIVEP